MSSWSTAVWLDAYIFGFAAEMGRSVSCTIFGRVSHFLHVHPRLLRFMFPSSKQIIFVYRNRFIKNLGQIFKNRSRAEQIFSPSASWGVIPHRLIMRHKKREYFEITRSEDGGELVSNVPLRRRRRIAASSLIVTALLLARRPVWSVWSLWGV